MKILAINSSFRGEIGFSKVLLDKLFEGAQQEGAECEILNLTEFKINHCIDCQVCQKPDHFLKCVFEDKDDTAFIFSKMRQADIIVFATPVYTLGISSLLKTLFERYYSTSNIKKFNITKSGLFFHNVDNEISNKPFVALVVYDNLEDEMPKNIISYFKTYAKFSDIEMAGTLIRKSAGMFKSQNKEQNNARIISEVYNSYILAGKELATLKKIKKSTEKKANQPIIKIPVMAKLMLKFGLGRDKVLEVHGRMMKAVIDRE